MNTNVDPWLATITWVYLVTNAARLFTYLPQIFAVYRARDGARALSLLTWSSWVVAHATAVLYGVLVIADGFFVCVSTINLACTAVVTIIATRRRLSWRREQLPRRPRRSEFDAAAGNRRQTSPSPAFGEPEAVAMLLSGPARATAGVRRGASGAASSGRGDD